MGPERGQLEVVLQLSEQYSTTGSNMSRTVFISALLLLCYLLWWLSTVIAEARRNPVSCPLWQTWNLRGWQQFEVEIRNDNILREFSVLCCTQKSNSWLRCLWSHHLAGNVYAPCILGKSLRALLKTCEMRVMFAAVSGTRKCLHRFTSFLFLFLEPLKSTFWKCHCGGAHWSTWLLQQMADHFFTCLSHEVLFLSFVRKSPACGLPPAAELYWTNFYCH